MNVDNGRILFKDDLERAMEGMDELERKMFMRKHERINDGWMTDKQVEEKQVSKFDNKSRLGKSWTKIRKERTAKKKMAKKSRAKNR